MGLFAAAGVGAGVPGRSGAWRRSRSCRPDHADDGSGFFLTRGDGTVLPEGTPLSEVSHLGVFQARLGQAPYFPPEGDPAAPEAHPAVDAACGGRPALGGVVAWRSRIRTWTVMSHSPYHVRRLARSGKRAQKGTRSNSGVL